MDITIANIFAEDVENLVSSSTSVSNRTPSPKVGGIMRVRTPTDLLSPYTESLSNRVSFFIDDEMEMPSLKRELSLRPERRLSPKIIRHHSDVSSMRRSKRLQRKRSAKTKCAVRHESLEQCEVKICTRCGSVRCKDVVVSDSRSRPGSIRMKRDDGSFKSRKEGSFRSRTDGSFRSRNDGSFRSRKSSVSKRSTSSMKLPSKDLPPKERRRRIIVLVVVVTCLFLVSCSVLVVILTLTHSAFYNKSYSVAERQIVRNVFIREQDSSEFIKNASLSSPADVVPFASSR